MAKERHRCTWQPVKDVLNVCIYCWTMEHLYALQLVDMGNVFAELFSIAIGDSEMVIDVFHYQLMCYRFPGSTPLHLAARGGSLDCIRELLAWGADRLQRDASGYFLFPFLRVEIRKALKDLPVARLFLCSIFEFPL